MKTAYEQGTLVLLENFDPSLTSVEVENIIWNGFNESCTAKVIQRTAFSSPHSGQAFVIFKKKDAAELVAKKLDNGCFLMSNGRPLFGSIGRPCFPEKKPIFYGHHVLDQHRTQMQREMKDAVSTSHCSQPNNIEYEMALEWCLLQERSDKAWSRLFKQQGEELRKVKAKMKSK
ncbi:putative RNA recognition motif domain-containing protein [Lupinus albus]|uniref:Putative RNA recognition motif domain-containing protein n=1 Tax=Lupinus albus TaxID=3870 RepID=A0A6A4Q6M9_LUPAL|nr:putative RNA recognition motif domain-containing protein [Lupinus albus]